MEEENQQKLDAVAPADVAPSDEKRRHKSSERSVKKVNDYATANMSLLLLKYAAPAVVGLLCNGAQNIINRIFVGRSMGSLALAGVYIGFPVMTMFMAFTMLIGIGGMTLIAIRLGQNRKDDAEKILGMITLLLFLIPTVICVALQPFMDEVLTFLGASPDVLPYARDYFKIFMIGMIVFTPSGGLNNIIRAQGSPGIAMGTQIIASVLIVVLNYFFVTQFGWGVKGAAWGLVLGNLVSLCWVLGFFFSKASYLKIHWNNMRIFPRLLGKIAVLGISPFLIQLANSAQQFIFNHQLTVYGGDTAIAAISIVMSLSSILSMPILGTSQGASPIIGYNYGAGNYFRVRGVVMRACLYATVLAIVCFILCECCSYGLVHIFTSGDEEVNALAAHALKIYFMAMPVVGFQMIGTAFFQASGKAFRAAFLSLARQVILFIPFLLTVPTFMGLDGVWASAPMSDLLSAIITFIFMVVGMRGIKKELAQKSSGKLVS